MVTRAEHLAFCKQRALEYVELGDLINAVGSMFSDLGKHDETIGCVSPELATEGMTFAALNDADNVRRWIGGFN